MHHSELAPLLRPLAATPVPRLGIIGGGQLAKMTAAAAAPFGVPYELRVVSAHRTPRDMARYAETAERRGLRVVIAGAGGAAHLPGMVASHTTLPVIGVPIESKALHGLAPGGDRSLKSRLRAFRARMARESRGKSTKQ